MALPASCTELLQTTVGIDTVNSRISGKPHAERPLAEVLETLANELGFTTRRLITDDPSFNLLVTHEVAPDAPWLMFESHLDTVSVDNMTIDPFAAVIKDGRLYGRGACDTKGSGAAMLWALKQYRELSTTPNNIAILYTLDEELGKSGVRTFVKKQMSTLDWRPFGVIVGEPTMLGPVVAHNGLVRCSITTRGVAAHSADPSQGRSAISAMMKVIDRLESEYIPSLNASHPLTGKAQGSVNVIRGGTQVNIIPEACTIQTDRRVVPGEDLDAILPAIRKLLDDVQGDHPEVEASIGPDVFLDPPLNPAGSESFIAFVQSVLREQGLPPAEIGVGYGTDASTFTPAGIPAVVLGPGDIAQAHTCDEWIALDQLERGVDVYLAMMCTPWKEQP